VGAGFSYSAPRKKAALLQSSTTTPTLGSVRIIYLTLGVFILLGIGATCRTPAVIVSDCPADAQARGDCIRKAKGQAE
jgi:hypothetical protein